MYCSRAWRRGPAESSLRSLLADRLQVEQWDGSVRAVSEEGPPFLRELIGWVALGGACGALTRYSLTLVFPETPGEWPWATLVANMLGCLLMGLFLGFLSQFREVPLRTSALIATGFLGGLTTFSTYASDAVTLVDAGEAVMAGLYLATTVAAGWILVRVGWEIGRWGRGDDEAVFSPAEMGE